MLLKLPTSATPFEINYFAYGANLLWARSLVVAAYWVGFLVVGLLVPYYFPSKFSSNLTSVFKSLKQADAVSSMLKMQQATPPWRYTPPPTRPGYCFGMLV